MSKTYITLIVLVLVVGGAFVLWRGKTLEAPAVDNSTMDIPESTTQSEESGTSVETNLGVTVGAVKEFTITGSNFAFSPNVISVKKGDKVKINFKNADGYHNLLIDEFNVTTKTISGGASDTVEFTADKTGSFQYYCAVGNHRAMGMWGTLKVE